MIRRGLGQRHLEGEKHPRQLVIEVLTEMVRRELDAGAHALALGVSHGADPAVLQRSQDDQRHAKDRDQISAAAALRLPFMPPSLASAFARKSRLDAGFTSLTNRLRAVDYLRAYDAYIAA